MPLSCFCHEKPIGSWGLKACKEGRIFNIDYLVICLTLHEQNLYPISFSGQVHNYALQPVI